MSLLRVWLSNGSRVASSSCFGATRGSSISAAAAAAATSKKDGLPASVERVGEADFFPNEGPGRVILFNWQLNKDGVTPLKESAFRISKPLDLKVAGLAQPKTNPLKIKAAPSSSVPEAGSSDLSFDDFDAAAGRVKDALSRSPHLYCPEGHAPGTRTSVRVITNAADLAPAMVGWLDRAPRREIPESSSVTVYAHEGSASGPAFSGHAVEEVEETEFDVVLEPKSVASVVVSSDDQTLDMTTIAAGIEACVKALEADEKEREHQRRAEDDQNNKDQQT